MALALAVWNPVQVPAQEGVYCRMHARQKALRRHAAFTRDHQASEAEATRRQKLPGGRSYPLGLMPHKPPQSYVYAIWVTTAPCWHFVHTHPPISDLERNCILNLHIFATVFFTELFIIKTVHEFSKWLTLTAQFWDWEYHIHKHCMRYHHRYDNNKIHSKIVRTMTQQFILLVTDMHSDINFKLVYQQINEWLLRWSV